jgi:hypothetical protein
VSDFISELTNSLFFSSPLPLKQKFLVCFFPYLKYMDLFTENSAPLSSGFQNLGPKQQPFSPYVNNGG